MGLTAAPEAQAAAEAVAFAGQHETPADRARRARLKVIITQAMDGTLQAGPLDRRHVKRFSNTHVAILLDIAGGMKYAEAAAKHGVSTHTVTILAQHPFSEIIFGELASISAERMTDPIARIRGVANEMVNTSLEIVRDPTTKKDLRHKIAADFLDRAGFGAVQKTEAKHEHVLAVPAAFAARIAAGLHSDREIKPDYSRFLLDPAGLQGGEVISEESETLTPGSGQTEESAGASPGPSPVTPQAVA